MLEQLLKRFYRNKKHPILPHRLFLLGTFFFPQCNVELIIKDKASTCIFTWRDDSFGNKGWHLPGGIIRPNESYLNRVKEVLWSEIPEIAELIESRYSLHYLGISEVIKTKPSYRSHFISLVFLLKVNFEIELSEINNEHILLSKNRPKDLIKNHLRYGRLVEMDVEELSKNCLMNIPDKNQ